MSKKSGNEKDYLPMFFRLSMVSSVSGSKPCLLETGVCIDFNKGIIYFSNPETTVYFAKEYTRSLPDFFGIRAICIGLDDFDESILSHVD